MTFGPDGNLSISNVGSGAPPVGLGQILKARLPDDGRDGDRDEEGDEGDD